MKKTILLLCVAAITISCQKESTVQAQATYQDDSPHDVHVSSPENYDYLITRVLHDSVTNIECYHKTRKWYMVVLTPYANVLPGQGLNIIQKPNAYYLTGDSVRVAGKNIKANRFMYNLTVINMVQWWGKSPEFTPGSPTVDSTIVFSE